MAGVASAAAEAGVAAVGYASAGNAATCGRGGCTDIRGGRRCLRQRRPLRSRPLQAHPKLPLPVQAGYATADIGLNAVETALRLYVLVFYTDAVGLSAALGGLAASLAIVWDAVTDPIMGVVSDRTRHRFGGRRMWLVPGGLSLALGVLAVFFPPALGSQAAKFGWLLGSFCFLNTGMTVLSVPFQAMAGEMTEDPHQRNVLFGWRFAFANVGALVAAALPQLFHADGETTAATLPQVSLVAAGLVVATSLTSWAATAKVRFLLPPLQPQSFAGAFAAPFANRAFRPLLLAYVVASVGIGVNATAFFYYYRHVLRLPEDRTLVVLATFMAVFTLSIAAWVQLARRFGKRRPLVAGAGVLGVGTALLYWLAPGVEGRFELVLWAGAVGLGGFVGSVVLIDAMLTDVLDHDCVRTRQLRSGLFFGVWRFAGKVARALAVAFAGFALDLAGFVEGAAAQPPQVATALTWMFGPGVGAAFVLTAFVLWRYRFDERKQGQARAILARRAAVRQPVTPASAR